MTGETTVNSMDLISEAPTEVIHIRVGKNLKKIIEEKASENQMNVSIFGRVALAEKALKK
jgi:hypothetical protein